MQFGAGTQQREQGKQNGILFLWYSSQVANRGKEGAATAFHFSPNVRTIEDVSSSAKRAMLGRVGIETYHSRLVGQR